MIYANIIWWILAISMIILFFGKSARETFGPTPRQKRVEDEEPTAPVTISTPVIAKTIAEKEKEKTHHEFSFGWGTVIIIAVLIGGIYWISSNKETYIASTEKVVGAPATAPDFSSTMDSTLAAIAEHESGGQQFDKDGKTPLYNKGDDGKIGNGDVVCKYQINMKAHADLIKEMEADVAHSEKDCERVAQALYTKWGAWPWIGGISDWGPKVAGGKFYLIMPVGSEWGAQVPFLDGFRRQMFSEDGGCYQVKNQTDETLIDCPGTPLIAFKSAFPGPVQFRSVKGSEVKVGVYFSKS